MHADTALAASVPTAATPDAALEAARCFLESSAEDLDEDLVVTLVSGQPLPRPQWPCMTLSRLANHDAGGHDWVPAAASPHGSHPYAWSCVQTVPTTNYAEFSSSRQTQAGLGHSIRDWMNHRKKTGHGHHRRALDHVGSSIPPPPPTVSYHGDGALPRARNTDLSGARLSRCFRSAKSPFRVCVYHGMRCWAVKTRYGERCAG